MKFRTNRWYIQVSLLGIFFMVALVGLVPKLANASSAIPVGDSPSSLDLVGTHLYVVNRGSNTISTIDTTTNTVAGTTTGVGASPSASILVGGRYLYITNDGSGYITIIDTNDNSVGTPITLGGTARSFTLVNNRYLYVTQSGSSSVSVIDTNDNSVSSFPITVGNGPQFSTLVGGRYLYVLNYQDGTSSIIDTTNNTVTDTITVGDHPSSAALVGGRYLYVNQYSSNSVSIIDTNDNSIVGSPITVGSHPSSSTLVGGRYLYVSTSDGISIIDTNDNSVTAITISSTGASTLIGGRYLYVIIGSSVSIIDTNDNSIVIIPPPVLITAGINSAALTLTYDESLDTGSIPSVGDFIVNVNSTPVSISGVSVTGSTVVLTLADPVVFGNNINISYTPGINTIKDLGSNEAVALSSENVTNNTSLTHTLIYSSDSNGSVTSPGGLSQIVIDGSDGSAVTAIPNTGYSFVNWDDAVTDNPRTDTNVTTNITVTANFSLDPIYGCTDSNANNYDSNANTDDGSCLYNSLPTILNTSATSITPTTAILGGRITDTGGENAYERGVLYALASDLLPSPHNIHSTIPESGSFGTGTFSGLATDLTCGSDYVYGVYAKNTIGQSVIGTFGLFTTAGCSGSNSGRVTVSGTHYGCKDPQATNYEYFSSSKPDLCKYSNTSNAPSTEKILGSGVCPTTLTISDKMKQGAHDGQYSDYNKGIVKQVSILQGHINRILAAQYKQAAGPTDGIFGPLTKQGVERLQTVLNAVLKPTPLLKIDGIVGQFTKAAINNSCGGM